MPNLCIIPARALADERVKPTHLRALLAVGTFTGRDGGGVWASNATLAEVANLHERHLRDALRELVLWGYVRKQPRPGRTAMLAIVLDDPLPNVAEVPRTESVQGGRTESVQTPRTKSVRQTTPGTPPVNDSPPARGFESRKPGTLPSVLQRMVADHHRVAYRALISRDPTGRMGVDIELFLRAEGGERPGVGLVRAEGWARVGEALHQMTCDGRRFSVRSLHTFLEGLDPLPPLQGRSAPAVAPPTAPLGVDDLFPESEPDPFAQVGL